MLKYWNIPIAGDFNMYIFPNAVWGNCPPPALGGGGQSISNEGKGLGLQKIGMYKSIKSILVTAENT